MNKYAMYLRKSRADIEAEKLGEGETLKKHREILTALATRQGLLVDKVFEEIVSGETIEARPQIKALMAECYEGKYRGIICIDPDRLSRGNMGDAQTIIDCLKFSNNNNGLLVVTPTKSYDVAHNPEDEEYMEFVLFMSRREYKTIQKRLDRGRKQSVVEGNYMGSYRPYGYDIVKNKYSRTLEPNPNEAPIVEKMFDWRVNENLSPGAIAKRLNLQSIPTYRGGEWNGSVVRTILQNPTYTGKVRWNDRMIVKKMVDGQLIKTRPRNTGNETYMLYDGKHPAIISADVFEAANSKFYLDKTKGELGLKNCLAGLIFCSKCGKAMRYQGFNKTTARPRLVHCFETKCNVKSVAYDDVLDALVYGLKMELEDMELKFDDGPIIFDTESQVEALEESRRKTEKVLDKLYQAWEDGLLNDSEFIQRKQINLEKIESIKKEIASIESSIPKKEEVQEKTALLSDAIELLKDEDIDAKSKNQFLKSIVDKIYFSRENSAEFILDIELL